MSEYFRGIKLIIYFTLFSLGVGTISCKNEELAVCSDIGSTDIKWLESMSNYSFSFVSPVDTILITFGSIKYKTYRDELCETNASLTGSILYKSGTDLSIKFTSLTSNEDNEVDEEVMIKIGNQSLASNKSPFYKYNRATYYREITLGNRIYYDVYKLPLSTELIEPTSLMFQVDQFFLTESAGIIGFTNLVDGNGYFRIN
ncbi:MAG: hypothetical protein ACPGEG_08625 [Salibacteraceae bacterium]